jgi:hypothetical protein
MIMPLNLLHRFTAIGARPAAIPLLDDTPNRATLRIVFNLAETCMNAALALRPARTLVETNSGVLALQNINRSFTGVTCTAAGFRAFLDRSRASCPVLQVCAGRHNEANACACN